MHSVDENKHQLKFRSTWSFDRNSSDNSEVLASFILDFHSCADGFSIVRAATWAIIRPFGYANRKWFQREWIGMQIMTAGIWLANPSNDKVTRSFSSTNRVLQTCDYSEHTLEIDSNGGDKTEIKTKKSLSTSDLEKTKSAYVKCHNIVRQMHCIALQRHRMCNGKRKRHRVPVNLFLLSHFNVNHGYSYGVARYTESADIRHSLSLVFVFVLVFFSLLFIILVWKLFMLLLTHGRNYSIQLLFSLNM